MVWSIIEVCVRVVYGEKYYSQSH